MMRARIALALLASVTGTLCAASPSQATSTSSAAAASPLQTGWNAQKKRVTLPSGIELAYVELGDPSGRPLLLLHGFTDTSRSWSLMTPYLGKFRLIIPDQRGHGASSAPSCCYNSAQMAEDARQLLDALKIERAAIAGHSMGSMVAIGFAAEHPERVDRIALIGSTALVPLKRGDWLWTNVHELKWPLDPQSKFLREWHPSNQPTPIDPAFAEKANEEMLAIPRQVWRGVMRELTDVPVARHAADIHAPVLVLSGSLDPLFTAEHHQALLKAFPKAGAHVYPGLGHNFHWEQPQAVAKAIETFMGQ